MTQTGRVSKLRAQQITMTKIGKSYYLIGHSDGLIGNRVGTVLYSDGPIDQNYGIILNVMIQQDTVMTKYVIMLTHKEYIIAK